MSGDETRLCTDKLADDRCASGADEQLQLVQDDSARVSSSAGSAIETETIATADEDAQPCEEWEIFSNQSEEVSEPAESTSRESKASAPSPSSVASSSQDTPTTSARQIQVESAPEMPLCVADDVADSSTELPTQQAETTTDTLLRRIQVCVRVRPLLRSEDQALAVTLGDTPNSLCVRSLQSASVTQCPIDRVFTETATQEELFATIRPSIDAVLAGYNATVFAYGQTGTGKTFTIFGADEDWLGHNDVQPLWGVIPRALAHLQQAIDQAKCNGQLTGVQVRCSIMQIYNDHVFDLLVDRRKQRPLTVREQPVLDGSISVVLPGLTSEPMESLLDGLRVVQRGRQSRFVRETEFNPVSSRSHAIVQVTVSGERAADSAGRSNPLHFQSRLTLVDLAGSEKWNTDVVMEEKHSDELKNINSSLSALGNCMAALRESGRKHIPYRDSMLTRVLQNSLGGNAFTWLIATISPSLRASEETLRTLQFADRARSVMQVIRVNEALSGSPELLVAKAEIVKLRDRLDRERRRARAAQVKERESIQQEFEGKLRAKEQEIQRLAQDNDVYMRWRQEDTTKIRELEMALKAANANAQRNATPATQKSRDVNTTTSASPPSSPASSFSESNAKSSRDQAERVWSARQRAEASAVRTVAILKSTQNGKQQTQSYRSLLEQFTVDSTRPVRGESHWDAAVKCQRPPSSRSICSSRVASSISPDRAMISPADPARHEPSPRYEDIQRRRPVLERSISELPLSTNEQRQHGNTVLLWNSGEQLIDKTSVPAWSSSHDLSTLQSNQSAEYRQQPAQTHGSRDEQAQRTAILTASTTSPAELSARQLTDQAASWRQRASFSVLNQQEDPTVTTTLEASKRNAMCAKHHLQGCVLCGSFESRSTSIPPMSTSVATAAMPMTTTMSSSISSPASVPSAASETSSASANARCERHHLAGCFLCQRTTGASSQASIAPTRIEAMRGEQTRSSLNQTLSAAGAASSSTSSSSIDQAMTAKPERCAAHSLSNCVLCGDRKANAMLAQMRPSISPSQAPMDITTSSSTRVPAANIAAMHLASAMNSRDLYMPQASSIAPSSSLLQQAAQHARINFAAISAFNTSNPSHKYAATRSNVTHGATSDYDGY